MNNGGADEFVSHASGETPDYYISPENSARWNLLTNVQCEACHGPVGDQEGILDWNHTTRITNYSSQNCGVCHQSEHHPYLSEWEESGHASGAPAWFKNREANSDCFYCHFAQDFVAFLNNPSYDAGNFQIEGGDENLQDITCVACHNPHGNNNTANLKNLPQGFEGKIICDVCHTVQETEIDFHDTPHHTTSELLSGSKLFGWQYPEEDYGQAKSFHVLIRERCVACHVHSTPYNAATGETAVTGHKFEPRVEACVECHPDYYDVLNISDPEKRFDYRGAQTLIKGLIQNLETLLSNASSADSNSDRFLKANYNLIAAKAEGSFGIHNTKLVQKLLEDSIAKMTVASVENNDEIPVVHNLSQNYPNPFNPTTTIKFTIPEASNIKIIIYNALGKEVKTLMDEFKERGSYTLEWNATNLSSGIYIYKMETQNFFDVKKMLLLK
ncbi:MAG: hypothetical protein A2V66_13960 [Ignavibacteria bacterium RBG_13_36_8]|nr:MAG: hypothetical protein A2V66_13960 [Ignavibacteria bacterium RBG_13_36_8]